MTPPIDNSAPRRLEQRPLGSQIADRVRQDILLGRLHAGDPVSQDQLCALYGTSRMPVRDALRQLASEGFVIYTQGGRLAVAPLTMSDIEDSFGVEALVHGRAARRATRNATAEDLDRLEELHLEMRKATREGDLSRVAELNWQFHRTINLLANSPKLLAILRTASLSIPRDYLTTVPKSEVAKSHRDHAAIIAAMREGDDAEVDNLVYRHVEKAGKRLVAQFLASGLLSDEGKSAKADADGNANRVRRT